MFCPFFLSMYYIFYSKNGIGFSAILLQSADVLLEEEIYIEYMYSFRCCSFYLKKSLNYSYIYIRCCSSN